VLTFVTWLWASPPGYRSQFKPAHVNVLRRMVARHYAAPHRFLCVTDQVNGLDAEVEAVKPWNDFAHVPNPSGSRNPSCYRRLRAFHPEIGSVFGERFVSLDLDLVVTDDLTPLFDRTEDFVIWGDTNPRTFYNGSLLLMTAGARPQVWEKFNPTKSPNQARAAGHFGSDQGWISHCLGPKEATWTTKDGVYSYQRHLLPKDGALPAGARVVVFHGGIDPWSSQAKGLAWVREAYR
jgi:hypothetical protein